MRLDAEPALGEVSEKGVVRDDVLRGADAAASDRALREQRRDGGDRERRAALHRREPALVVEVVDERQPPRLLGALGADPQQHRVAVRAAEPLPQPAGQHVAVREVGPHVERGRVGEAEREEEPHLLGVARVPQRLDAEALHLAGEPLGEAVQAAAGVERLHLAEVVEVDGLDARQRLDGRELAVGHDLDRVRVVLDQLLGRVGEAEVERRLRLGRDVADEHADVARRVEARDGAHHEQVGEPGREAGAGDHPPPPGVGVLGERVGVVLHRRRRAEVDKVGAGAERQPGQPRVVLRPDARDHDGAAVEQRLERGQVARVRLVGAELGVREPLAQGADADRLRVAHLDARDGVAPAEIVGDGGADGTRAEHADGHGWWW